MEEFGLVGGHVHAGRALRPAPLAGQAEVERLAHLLAAPAVAHHLPLQHLVEEPGPAARGVPLVAGRPIAGAHDPTRVPPAPADPHAAGHGAGEASGILW